MAQAAYQHNPLFLIDSTCILYIAMEEKIFSFSWRLCYEKMGWGGGVATAHVYYQSRFLAVLLHNVGS